MHINTKLQQLPKRWVKWILKILQGVIYKRGFKNTNVRRTPGTLSHSPSLAGPAASLCVCSVFALLIEASLFNFIHTTGFYMLYPVRP